MKTTTSKNGMVVTLKGSQLEFRILRLLALKGTTQFATARKLQEELVANETISDLKIAKEAVKSAFKIPFEL